MSTKENKQGIERMDGWVDDGLGNGRAVLLCLS